MFKYVSVAEFEVNGLKAQLIIDNKLSVTGLQAILNKLMHFCVEKQKEAENEEAQRLKDEEDSKMPELEAAIVSEVEEEIEEELAE